MFQIRFSQNPVLDIFHRVKMNHSSWMICLVVKNIFYNWIGSLLNEWLSFLFNFYFLFFIEQLSENWGCFPHLNSSLLFCKSLLHQVIFRPFSNIKWLHFSLPNFSMKRRYKTVCIEPRSLSFSSLNFSPFSNFD